MRTVKPAEWSDKCSAEDEAKVIVLRPRMPQATEKPPRPPRRAKRKRPIRWVKPVDDATRAFDPLSRETTRTAVFKKTALYLSFALGLQASLAVLLIVLGSGEARSKKPRIPENVVVSIAPPKPIEEPPVTVETPAQPDPEPVREQTKVAPRPAKRTSVDPVDVPEVSKPFPPARRVVGISFESTVEGGQGPSLAVGNTRMGEGGEIVAPSSVKSQTGESFKGPGAAAENRVASFIPTEGDSLVKPKRKGTVEPQYPSLLKAQGIEGDTTVLVRISETGEILDVKVVKGSGQKAFDDAALVAAKKERFEPALRNGAPIPYTLKYTYRFQIKDR